MLEFFSVSIFFFLPTDSSQSSCNVFPVLFFFFFFFLFFLFFATYQFQIFVEDKKWKASHPLLVPNATQWRRGMAKWEFIGKPVVTSGVSCKGSDKWMNDHPLSQVVDNTLQSLLQMSDLLQDAFFFLAQTDGLSLNLPKTVPTQSNVGTFLTYFRHDTDVALFLHISLDFLKCTTWKLSFYMSWDRAVWGTSETSEKDSSFSTMFYPFWTNQTGQRNCICHLKW